jgi:hypothetical protein
MRDDAYLGYMPRSTAKDGRARRRSSRNSSEPRYTVSLDVGVADKVERYARTVDTSMSKAIAALVRLGLEGQEVRKREFFRKLKENLADDNPRRQDQLVDEFRTLILGR